MRRSPTAGWPASRSSTCRGSPSPTQDGITFLDPSTGDEAARSPSTVAPTAWRSSPASTTPKVYVDRGHRRQAGLRGHRRSAAKRRGRPDRQGHAIPLPGPATRVAYDEASQQVHVLGRHAGPARAAGRSTSIEPHGTRVYADARLPAGSRRRLGHRRRAGIPERRPRAAARRSAPTAGRVDRGRLARLRVAAARRHRRRADGRPASTCWPGSCSGAGASRRSSAMFAWSTGCCSSRSRIGMNDVYVGMFIVAAYTIFAALLDRLVARSCRVLARHADRSALLLGLGARLEVGGGLRDRRARDPPARAQRARPGGR